MKYGSPTLEIVNNMMRHAAPSPLVGFHDGSGVIGNEIKASSNNVKWR